MGNKQVICREDRRECVGNERCWHGTCKTSKPMRQSFHKASIAWWFEVAGEKGGKDLASSKVVSLKEAVQEIQDGDVVFLGGLIDCRRPMAAVYEMVRQKKRGLILLAECSLAEDILVGAGCVAAWRGCYTGMASFGLSPATQRKIEHEELIPDEIGHIDIILGAMAAMAGSLFVATRVTLGSDVLNPSYDRTACIRNLARNPETIPRKKFVLVEDPFYGQGTVKLQPAMRIDVAVIHVQEAGEEGTARIQGSLAFDHYAVHAARKVIITAERVVPEEYLRRDPNRNQIPATSVDRVVEVPWGGHPSQVPGFYDVDMPYIRDYSVRARTEEGFKNWLDEWVVSLPSREAYLDKLGAARLEKLRSVPPFGYRPRRAHEAGENRGIREAYWPGEATYNEQDDPAQVGRSAGEGVGPDRRKHNPT